MLLEADGCCIDLNECASSSITERKSNNQHSPVLAMVTANHEDERKFLLGRFLEGSERKCGNCVVGVHCSLKVADERLRFLVRVSLVIAFRSLTISYEVSAQSGREESSSVNAVH